MKTPAERFSSMDWQQVSEFARQKLIDDGEKRIRLLELAAGFQEQDWCRRGHTGYVITGSLEVEFEDRRADYPSGEPLLISSGQPHKARVTDGKTTLFLVDEV